MSRSLRVGPFLVELVMNSSANRCGGHLICPGQTMNLTTKSAKRFGTNLSSVQYLGEKELHHQEVGKCSKGMSEVPVSKRAVSGGTRPPNNGVTTCTAICMCVQTFRAFIRPWSSEVHQRPHITTNY